MDAYRLSDTPKEWGMAPHGSVPDWMESEAYNKSVSVSQLEFHVTIVMPDSNLAREYLAWHTTQEQRDLAPVTMESAITFSDTYGASKVAAMERSLMTLGKPSQVWCGLSYSRKLEVTFRMVSGGCISFPSVSYTDKLHELTHEILTWVASEIGVLEEDIDLSFVHGGEKMNPYISLSRAGVSDQDEITVIVKPDEPPPLRDSSDSDDEPPPLQDSSDSDDEPPPLAAFNNADHTGTYAKKGGCQPTVREDFNHTRERYSTLTALQWWGHTDPDVPPEVAILFRAKRSKASQSH